MSPDTIITLAVGRAFMPDKMKIKMGERRA